MFIRDKKIFWPLLSAELLLIALLPHWGDLAVHGNPQKFVTCYLFASCAYLGAVVWFNDVSKAARPKVFWMAAIALRLAVFAMPPGDDVWRYLWEGKVQLHGFNPYLHSPHSDALALLRDAFWRNINHSEWPAIYPPGAEWLFAQMARISTQPIFFKVVFTLADLLVVFLLLRTNTGRERYRATAWFAWNPLVVCAFAGAGHFDSVMLLALVAAVWALHRADPLGQQAPAWSWSLASAVFLGLAISLKTVPLFLLPVWAFALGARSVVLVLSIGIPWLFSLGYGGIRVVSQPLREFAKVTRFNDVLWWFTEKTIWPNPAQKNGVYMIVLCVVVAALAWVFHKDWRRAALWVLGAVLVLSPALHPWYVTWILPLACWRKNFAWFVFSISAQICLLAWEAGPFWVAWKMSPALHLLVVMPPLLALVFLRIRKAGKQEI